MVGLVAAGASFALQNLGPAKQIIRWGLQLTAPVLAATPRPAALEAGSNRCGYEPGVNTIRGPNVEDT